MTALFLIIFAAYIGCVGIPAAIRYDRAMQDPASTEYQDTHKEHHNA